MRTATREKNSGADRYANYFLPIESTNFFVRAAPTRHYTIIFLCRGARIANGGQALVDA